MGYDAVGNDYYSLGELERASEYFTKAFELREHASERERLLITAAYYSTVTGELEKAAQTYQEWIESYPRDYRAHVNLGIVYDRRGSMRRPRMCTTKASASNRIDVISYENLAHSLLALQRFDEARQIIQEAQARKIGCLRSSTMLSMLWLFSGADSPAMAEQQQWFAGQPDVENFGLSLASDTEAFGGHLGKARELTKRSVDSAIRADSKENGAIWQENAALREAAFGNAAEAKRAAAAGLKLAPESQGVESRSRACICHGGRYGASRILSARSQQTLSAGHPDAVSLAASDSSAISAESEESACRPQ